MDTIVIIPSAGKGIRLGGDIPKQYLKLKNIPVLIRTMLAFEEVADIDSYIIAINPYWEDFVAENIKIFGIKKEYIFVKGGKERQDSIYNALETDIASRSGLILVHDAVRPFASPKLINNIINTAKNYDAAIPGIPPVDTIKEINANADCIKTYDRDKLISVQTPQAFSTDLLISAYHHAKKMNFSGTDDASLVEYFGKKVKVIPGEAHNIKITTKFDMEIAEKILL